MSRLVLFPRSDGRRILMRPLIWILVAAVFMVASHANASMIVSNRLTIDFTDARKAKAESTWSEPDKIVITKDGLGWDGSKNSLREGWILSEPIATGTSWRPAQHVGVRVTIDPAPTQLTLDNGQTMTPFGGYVYARHSPDGQHWTDWQSLEPDEVGKNDAGRRFSGSVGIPERQRTQYVELLKDYAKLDVPWSSDEKAACEWIVKRDPNFFRDHKPFVGYVQVLFEADFYAGQRIKKLDIDTVAGISGTAAIPRDAAVFKKRDGFWNFKAPTTTAPTTVPSK